MNNVTLLAATRTDMPLAALVEGAIRSRTRGPVRVILSCEAPRAAAWDALVTAAGVDALRPIFESLQGAHPRASSGAVLIHPEPTAAHYKLALRSGIADVIAWPDEIGGWFPHGAVHDDERTLAALVLDEPLRRRIARIASFEANVLVVGETGSGKEEVARTIHALSARRHKPLVVVNCAALPEHLVESELFGYERGAFTGAQGAYAGKLGLAQGGTLFLDEIGDMPRAAQAKVLRVIEGGEYFRLGGSRAIASDVRLIAATHQDLEGMCARGDFRADLFFRLNVARIEVPPLRLRADAILPLAERFVRDACRAVGRAPMPLAQPVREALARYAWPGNVRQLRNAMETAVIEADGERIELADLPAAIVRWLESDPPSDERAQLVSVLRRVRWNKSLAARELHWSRMKLYRKLQLYRLGGETARDDLSR
jgi:DNA-binding NtrC family response regulator